MSNISRVFIGLILAWAGFAITPAAQAQTPVRIVSGFPPGGGVDAVARLLADQLTKQSGRVHIVENKSGAGGIIAVQSMLTAPADGSVLLLAPDSNIVIYPHTVSTPGFDALKDLAPISQIVRYDLALTVRGSDERIKNFKDLITLVKASPNAGNFASPSAGSLQHFYGLSVGQAAGVNLLHVAYRGVGPAITDTMAGVVTALVTPVGPVLQHAQSGGLRILATSGNERGAKTRDVPTLKELGYPQLVAHGWFGLFAPSRTPPDVLEKINAAVALAAKDREFRAKLDALDMEPSWTPASEFKAEVDAQNSNWAKLVRQSGFRADR